MSRNEPVVLELASLPREQMGPFLILGLEKHASDKDVDEHWADRVKWARRGLIKVPLEDINWARDQLRDGSSRLKADVASVNADTGDGVVAALSRKYGADGGQAARLWQPLDSEKALAEYTPAAEVPTIGEVLGEASLPTLPEEGLAGLAILVEVAAQPLDPWSVAL
jgi:hypothetical protein